MEAGSKTFVDAVVDQHGDRRVGTSATPVSQNWRDPASAARRHHPEMGYEDVAVGRSLAGMRLNESTRSRTSSLSSVSYLNLGEAGLRVGVGYVGVFLG